MDAREQAKHWVVFPSQMGEMLNELFSMFLERLVQFHWEAPDELFTVTREDIPIGPDHFVDFQSLNVSSIEGHVRRAGYEIVQYWLEFSWFSHAIQAAHQLDPSIPDDAMIWQELANQCYDSSGAEEHSRTFAAALNGVALSLRRIEEWASGKSYRLNARVVTGHITGISVEGRIVRRKGSKNQIDITKNEVPILNAVMRASTQTTGTELAHGTGKNTNAFDQAILRLNGKLSKLNLVIREYRLTDLRK